MLKLQLVLLIILLVLVIKPLSLLELPDLFLLIQQLFFLSLKAFILLPYQVTRAAKLLQRRGGTGLVVTTPRHEWIYRL